MKRWMAYVRLLRFRELIRLALLMVVSQWCIVEVGIPQEARGMGTEVHFYFAFVATLLIGAAGFAFNDYCDAKRDASEGEKMVIVGRVLVRRSVLLLHVVLTTLGVISGAVAARLVNNLWLFLLFPMAAGLLWYYSTLYRRQFVVGNLLKSLMVSGCGMLPVLFEVFYLEEMEWRRFALAEISITPLVEAGVGYALIVGVATFGEQLLTDVLNFARNTHCEKDTLAFRYGIFTAKMVTGGVIVAYFLGVAFFFVLLAKFYGVALASWGIVSYGVALMAVPIFGSLMALLAGQRVEHFKGARMLFAVGQYGLLLLPVVMLFAR